MPPRKIDRFLSLTGPDRRSCYFPDDSVLIRCKQILHVLATKVLAGLGASTSGRVLSRCSNPHHIRIPSFTFRVNQRYYNSARRGQIHRFSRRTSVGNLGCSGVRTQASWLVTPYAFSPKQRISGLVASTRSALLANIVVVNSPIVRMFTCTALYWPRLSCF